MNPVYERYILDICSSIGGFANPGDVEKTVDGVLKLIIHEQLLDDNTDKIKEFILENSNHDKYFAEQFEVLYKVIETANRNNFGYVKQPDEIRRFISDNFGEYGYFDEHAEFMYEVLAAANNKDREGFSKDYIREILEG